MLFYGWMGEKGRGPLDPGPIRSASSEKEGMKRRREGAERICKEESAGKDQYFSGKKRRLVFSSVGFPMALPMTKQIRATTIPMIIWWKELI